MENYRIESDTLGEVRVPIQASWGAQTQRSIENFAIGTEKMPIPLIKAFLLLKRACASANFELGKLNEQKKDSILSVCDDLLSTTNLMTHFPLVVWQTGSGTQTNMNINEVISHLAKKEAEIHPNDDVNMSQSSNDTFPTAMHISAFLEIEQKLLPALEKIQFALERKAKQFHSIVKIGRTHMQDATPLTVGQEFSGWVYMMKRSKQMLEILNLHLLSLTIGGTAVGTGINAPMNFGEMVCEELNRLLHTRFVSSENKFHGLTSHDEIVTVHGAIKAVAMDLMKMANDIRLLASGPRSGIGELILPANEPGSSIMPGKVNPTQCEAVTMVASQILGNDVTISFGASQGHMQLNVFKPVIIYNFLQSVELLTDSIHSFVDHCIEGIEVNEPRIKYLMEQSLMLVTAFNPIIGYEKSAKLAKYAYDNELSLIEANKILNYVEDRTFEEILTNSMKP